MEIINFSSNYVKFFMNLVFDHTKVNDLFYHTNLSHEVPLSFVLWSFQVLGKYLMDYGKRIGKSLSLGMPKAPQGNIQGISKQLSLGMPQNASPLLSLTLSVTLLEAIFLFTTWYVFCLERHFIFFCFACCLNKIPRSEILKW